MVFKKNVQCGNLLDTRKNFCISHPMSETMASDLAERFKNGIYFAIHDQPFDRLHYATGCLLEGLKDLGVPAFCNCPIPNMEVRGFDPLAYDLYVFNITERSASGPLLPFVEKFHRMLFVSLPVNFRSNWLFQFHCILPSKKRIVKE
jgi:hypothetical protein